MKFLIWSEEHGAWWKPNASGYTRELAKAGRYELKTAQEIVAAANEFLVPGKVHEILIPDPSEQ